MLPPTIDLVRVNSRLTMFGLLGGTGLGGGLAYGAREPGAFATVSLGYEVVQSLGWALAIRLQHTSSTTRGFAQPKSNLSLDLGLQLY